MEAPLLPFPEPQDALRLARTLSADDPLRARLEAAVARLEGLADEIIATVDKLDGDPDLEEGCDDNSNLAGIGPSDPRLDDAEADDADGEPSLGSQEGGHGGTYWNRQGSSRDGEGEPSLGWGANMSQLHLTTSPNDAEAAYAFFSSYTSPHDRAPIMVGVADDGHEPELGE